MPIKKNKDEYQDIEWQDDYQDIEWQDDKNSNQYIGKSPQDMTESLFEPSIMMETAQDAITALHQGATLGHSDEIAGFVSAVTEIATGGDIDKARIERDNTLQKWRGRIGQARERSPIAYNLTEMVTPNPLDALGIIGKFGTVGKVLSSAPVQGAIYGEGLSNKDIFKGESPASESMLGFGAGVIGSAFSKLAKAPFKGPRQKRQSRLGATDVDFRLKGRNSPEAVDEKLSEIGFFDSRPDMLEVDVDPFSLKVIPTNKKMYSIYPAENIRENVSSLIEKYSKLAKKELYDASDSIDHFNYTYDEFIKQPEIRNVLIKLENGSRGRPELVEARSSLMRRLKDSFNTTIGGILYIDDIDNMKRTFQELALNSLSETGNDTAISLAAKDIQRSINDFVERKMDFISKKAGKRFRDINDNISRLIVQEERLAKKVGYEKSPRDYTPYPTSAGVGQYGVQKATKSPFLGKLREEVGFAGEQNPAMSKYVDGVIRNSVMKPLTSKLVGAMNEGSDFIGQINSIPKMLAKQPIPRDSVSILENKEFVKAKIALQAPSMLEIVSHILDEQPGSVKDILPMIINIAPQIFEKDVYNRVDGKINDTIDREKALRDTRDSETLSNTEKAFRAHNIALNRMV